MEKINLWSEIDGIHLLLGHYNISSKFMRKVKLTHTHVPSILMFTHILKWIIIIRKLNFHRLHRLRAIVHERLKMLANSYGEHLSSVCVLHAFPPTIQEFHTRSQTTCTADEYATLHCISVSACSPIHNAFTVLVFVW